MTKQITAHNRKFKYTIVNSSTGRFVSIFPFKSKQAIYGTNFKEGTTEKEIKEWVKLKLKI